MSFSFIQITDHHLRESESLLSFGFSPWHALRATLRHIAEHAAHRADFLVTTGDLVQEGTDAEYRFVRAALGIGESSAPPGPQRVTCEGLRGMPTYFLPGNHDPRQTFFRNMFPGSALTKPLNPTRAAGGLQMNISFTHKGIRFICLDWGNENKAVASPGMFDFLARNLLDSAPSIVLMHHTVVPVGIPRIDSFLPDEIGAFADAVRGRNILAILCGHTHATYEAQIAGIPIYGLRSTTFSFAADGDKMLFVLRPPHYRVVTVSESGFSTEIVEVPL